MRYELVYTPGFKKDLRQAQKRNFDMEEMRKVLELLQSGEKLPARYKDHPLKGNLKGVRELHIQPDWLLMYIRNKRELVLTLTRTGTHADLLKR